MRVFFRFQPSCWDVDGTVVALKRDDWVVMCSIVETVEFIPKCCSRSQKEKKKNAASCFAYSRRPFLLHLHRSHFSPLKCHVTDETRVSVDSPKNWPTGTRPRTWVWLDICDATSKAAVRGAVVVPDRDTSNRGLGIVSLFLENTILLQLSTQSCNPDWFNTRLCSVTFVCMRKLNYV